MARTARRLLTWIVALVVLGAALAAAYVFVVLPGRVDAQLNAIAGRAIAVSDRAKALHRQLLVADLHADSLLFGRDLRERGRTGHLDLPRMREGNLALEAFTVVTKVPEGDAMDRNLPDTDQIIRVALVRLWPLDTWRSLAARALYQAGQLEQLERRSAGALRLVRTRAALDDLIDRRRTDRNVVGGWLGVEGAHALDGKVENLDRLYNAGFRMIGLAHLADNEFAGSAHGTSKHGLTPLGRQLIRNMEARGIIVDLAHSSPATIEDVLKIARRPLLVSHTGVKGTCDNLRNLSDTQLRAIAATGGIIGIGFWKMATCGSDATAIARALRYATGVVGVDHVALGSDFDGAVAIPFDASGLDQITQALVDAGFSAEDIRRIMGGNVVRFLQENLPQH
jgi:microsomal dipeptidase-like Zn-dependent dipeptidase